MWYQFCISCSNLQNSILEIDDILICIQCILTYICSSAYIFPCSNLTSSSNNAWNNTSRTFSNFTIASSASESPSSSIFSKATAFLADRQYVYKAMIYLLAKTPFFLPAALFFSRYNNYII